MVPSTFHIFLYIFIFLINIIDYFISGVDAEIALSFHKMREANTKLFQSQLVNKGTNLYFVSYK
jgi:cytochrome b561